MTNCSVCSTINHQDSYVDGKRPRGKLVGTGLLKSSGMNSWKKAEVSVSSAVLRQNFLIAVSIQRALIQRALIQRLRLDMDLLIARGLLMRLPVLCFLILMVWQNTVVADLVLDIEDTSFVSGGGGSVDVSVRSTGVDIVDFYQYRFEITGIGSSVGTLRFADPQSDLEGLDANYIFGVDSLGLTTFAENSPAFDSVTGSDLTLSGFGVAVGATDLLFARLEFEHILPGGVDPALAANDQFLVSLVDVDTTILSETADFVLFSGNSGTLSAIPVTVPEPSSLILTIAGVMACLIRRRRKITFDE